MLKESISKGHHKEEEKVKGIFREMLDNCSEIVLQKAFLLDDEVKIALKEIFEIKTILDESNLTA